MGAGLYDSRRAKRKKRLLRASIVVFLGSKCANQNCKWINEAGTIGCNDPHMLQIDHKNGGGTQERKLYNRCVFALYKLIYKYPDRYQLLCANCNWKKRFMLGEH